MAFNSVNLPLESPGDRLDQRSCRLLGATALVVQALMGIIVISSLLFKRHRESPKRPWAIWLFDVSKQVIGQMFVHGLNVLISDRLSHFETGGNACSYYFLNILVDTTLGVGIIYGILHLVTNFFSETLQLKGFESGQYGSPPSFKYWGRQTSIYVAALTTMKFTIIILFFLWPDVLKAGEWLMGLLGSDEHVQVIFTMGLFPIIMNVIQFWLIDSIVKARDGNWSQSRIFMPSSSGSDVEPLFGAPEDDDEDRRGRADAEAQHEQRRLGEPSSGAPNSLAAVVAPHVYPPTSSRPANARSPPPQEHGAPLGARRKGSLPTPLLPRSPMIPAINSPDPSTSEKWETSWTEEDWAERIGEEDWTGRRIEERRAAVHGAWT